MTGLLPTSDCPYCGEKDLPDYTWWVHIQRRHPEAISGPDFEEIEVRQLVDYETTLDSPPAAPTPQENPNP